MKWCGKSVTLRDMANQPIALLIGCDHIHQIV